MDGQSPDRVVGEWIRAQSPDGNGGWVDSRWSWWMCGWTCVGQIDGCGWSLDRVVDRWVTDRGGLQAQSDGKEMDVVESEWGWQMGGWINRWMAGKTGGHQWESMGLAQRHWAGAKVNGNQ